jgi:hypothetical protein
MIYDIPERTGVQMPVRFFRVIFRMKCPQWGSYRIFVLKKEIYYFFNNKIPIFINYML